MGCTTDKGSKSSTTENYARKALEAYVIDFCINRDVTALSKAPTEDMVYHYLGKFNSGDPASHQTALREFGSAFPDMKAKIDLLIVEGNMGAAFTTCQLLFPHERQSHIGTVGGLE
jgi:predicted ester cyclase